MVGSVSTSSAWHKHVHHFDIDNYLNHIVPRPRFYLLPRPISHFFGYRPSDANPQPSPGNPVLWISACLGGFIGIAIISAVYHALPLLGGEQVPVVIASFGAAAILEYNTIESPLSQPRNLVIGHVLSALVGVSITKGFQRLPEQRFEDLRWLAGSVSVGLASLVMSITKTVHPPAGATALLASTSREITVLSWWLLPLVLLASVLMSASALLINNITRRWPLYWWTPVDLSPATTDMTHVGDVEKQMAAKAPSIASGSTMHSRTNDLKHIDLDSSQSDSSSAVLDDSVSVGSILTSHGGDKESQIVITSNKIILPDWMEPDDWETEVLEILKQKLQRK